MRRLLAFLFPFSVLLLMATIIFIDPIALQMLRLKSFDILHARYPRIYNTELPVRIVDIDEESLKRFGQWPWPRNVMAQIVQRLSEANVASIGLDIVFAEPDRSSPAFFLRQWKQNTPQWRELMEHAADFDQMFAETLAQSPSVTGFVMSGDGGDIPILKKDFVLVGNDPSEVLDPFGGAVVTLPDLTKAARGNGALNSLPDRDGIIRRIPLVFQHDGQLYPSLIAEMLRVAQGGVNSVVKTVGAGGTSGESDVGMENNILFMRIGEAVIPTNKAGDFFVHYTEYTPERYIPAWKLLSSNFDLSTLEGYFVLIGTSAAGLKDIRATPLSQLSSGVEIHAQALEQVLTQEYLSRPDWLIGVEIMVMLVLGLVLILCMNFLNAVWGALLALMIFFSSLAGAAYAFNVHHMMIDAAAPGVGLLLLYMVESLRRYIITERERREIRHAFVHYMSPALVEKLAQNPQALKLGGEMREMTILFCDVRGFTTISEMYNAEELTRFINRFLTPMTDVILSEGGTIDKYMGDAIMAFWNAPLDEPDHARMACRAALKMLLALQELNERRQQEANETGSRFIPVQIGVGLNSGLCCVGNMGSDQRFDYSVLGDDVNLASRLEGQSKNYGVLIVLGENTQKQVSALATLELDLIRVKGKTEAVRIFTLVGDEELASRHEFQLLHAANLAMLSAYRASDWEEAEAQLSKALALAQNLGLGLEDFYGLYHERIRDYKKTPPRNNWDGVYEAKTK
jgi:adenylate cyclase